MTQQPYTRPEPQPHPYNDGIAPPPRLLWVIIGLFAFFVLVAIAAFVIYQTQQRLVALLPLGILVIFALMIGSFMTAILFRKSLPRRFALWLSLFFLILTLIGLAGSVFLFSNLLRPEYQQVIVEEVPFMRAFLPPTPEGGVLPTALPGAGGDISPEDLLSAPLLGATSTATPTETPETPTPTDQPTESALIVTVESPTPTEQPTSPPTPTPTSTPVEIIHAPENAVAVSIPSRPSRELMTGFTYVRQTWNNCGPANITMALSYFGWREDQSVAAAYLKPDREDKNVTPAEMVAFVNERTGVRAITRIGGDVDLLRDLLAARFPVIVETGTMFEGGDWLGHYKTLVGYDDLEGVFYIYDSWLGAGEGGAGRREAYSSLDEEWRQFNRAFIVVFEQDREPEVRRLLGDLADPTLAAENALVVAQEEALANNQDVYAWFNIGTALTKLGRYDEAARAYDRALQIGRLPWRMIWYQFGPFEAYFEVGRYDDVLALVNTNLTNGAQYVEETHYWQGRVFEVRGDIQAAINSYTRALQHNPRYAAAREARDALTR